MATYSNWPTIEYPGVAAFYVPPGAEQKLIDDGCTICVTHNATDVLAGLFALRQSSVANADSLELELRDFTDRCVRPCADVIGESYQTATEVDCPGVACIQSVLVIEADRLWIARAYGRIGGDELLLVHRNGPRQMAPTFSMPLFVSLVPLFALASDG